MNNKKLKKLLVEKAEKVQIEDCRQQIIHNTHHRVQPKVEKNKKVVEPHREKRNLKWLYPVCAVAVVLCLVFVMIPLAHNWGGTEPGENKPNTQLSVGKVEQVMSREVLALGNIVAGLDTIQPQQGTVLNASMLASELGEETDEEEQPDDLTSDSLISKTNEQIAQKINYYLHASESFLNKSGINIVYNYNQNNQFSQYEYMMSITYQDNDGYEVKYVAYYNQEDESDLEEGETKLEMNGVLVVDYIQMQDKQYEFKSERSVETDEVEMEMKVYLNAEKTSYISVENESGQFENEYEYKFVKDGLNVKKVEMEVENEGGYKTSSIKIIETNDGIEIETTCEFEFLTDDHIKCQYASGDMEMDIEIEVLDVVYRYMFEDNTIVELNKVIS